MSRPSFNHTLADFDAVRLAIASADDVLSWSYGEVLKPETINYRTQKPERDGLFCERIFGPVKDINVHDVKYKGVRSREAAVDKRGEIVTKSIVRRERMGHINLAAPVAHIWFMRGTPSAMGLLLGMTVRNLERVAYFASYIIKSVDSEKRDQMLADNEAEFEAAKVAIKTRYEQLAGEAGANLKALAAAQSKELDAITEEYLIKKNQLESLETGRLISETDYRNLSEDYQALVEVGMGGAALRDMLAEIDLNKLIEELAQEAQTAKGQRLKKVTKRLKVLEGMQRAGIKPTSMCVTVLPVIPPDLRPMVQLTGGRFATSDLNDLYRRVINRNNRLRKLLELNAPEVIRRNEQRMLQEAVDALIDNSAARSGRAVSATGGRRRLKSLSDMLKGKQGRFRQNLLGKRVDYSGRSVIVAGPELKIHQCGLPKLMALELFKPFVVAELMQNELAHNIKSATRLIESGDTVVWDALDVVIQDKYVLLNRAPSLHRLSIQAFQPKLIEGKAIQLHPLVCKGFNADFDGDQMAVHLPLSEEAQEEARTLMAATKNLLKPADGSPVLNIAQDIVLGCYYLTYDKPAAHLDKPRRYSSVAEAILAFDQHRIMLQTPIIVPFKGEHRQTTLGRVHFNEVLPEDFAYVGDVMTKKQLNKALSAIFEAYGQEQTARTADAIKDLSLKYATLAAVSTGMTDYFEVDQLDALTEAGEEKATKISQQYEAGLITEEERYNLTVQAWRAVDKQVTDVLQESLKSQDTSISVMVNSGARGDISNIKLATAMIGVMVDASGKEIELPIRSSYKKGLSPLEAFVATRGARKGLIDTALKTADSGYLTRRLVDVAQDIFTTVDANEIDDPGFAIHRSETEATMVEFGNRIYGRYAAETIPGHVDQGELITREIASAIQADVKVDSIKIMSVLTCKDLRGIAPKSYGIDMATGQLVESGQPAGVIAAQSVGEPGTQLTLKTFHASGVAGGDITQGLPRVDELFEARVPKGQAFMSEISGTAEVWEDGNNYIVQITPDKGRHEKLPLDGRKPHVKSGTEVLTGDVLAADKGDARPLTAPFDGVVEVTNDAIMLANRSQALARYEIPGFRQLTVQSNDRVEAGDRLTTGSLNLHDLMRLKGIEATQRYIINEVLRIYIAQGQNIADKHLEIIVRQMFSRVQIEDAGDSLFVTGDVVSKAAVIEANKQLADEGKQPAQYLQLLLGITKVSIWSDSFLSAASFQDTTRVLISAATAGRVDNLYGLKENVIIGRKIPVGTAVRPLAG